MAIVREMTSGDQYEVQLNQLAEDLEGRLK